MVITDDGARHEKVMDIFTVITYMVVVFSIVVQGLSIEKLLRRWHPQSGEHYCTHEGPPIIAILAPWPWANQASVSPLQAAFYLSVADLCKSDSAGISEILRAEIRR
jgi:hypothetical protein